MITQQQCKHVVSVIIQQLSLKSEGVPIVNRDMVHLNKTRAEICANIITNPLLRDILTLIHNADSIEQINSAPENQQCFITGKKLPTCGSGISIIIHNKDRTITHVCIQKKYQSVCLAYFKIRHFISHVENLIKNWLNTQDWYIPRTHQLSFLNDKLMDSNVPYRVFTDFIEASDTLTLVN
jgi:hypothetical protein